jgi:hypothetical protein
MDVQKPILTIDLPDLDLDNLPMNERRYSTAEGYINTAKIQLPQRQISPNQQPGISASTLPLTSPFSSQPSSPVVTIRAPASSPVTFSFKPSSENFDFQNLLKLVDEGKREIDEGLSGSLSPKVRKKAVSPT